MRKTCHQTTQQTQVTFITVNKVCEKTSAIHQTSPPPTNTTKACSTPKVVKILTNLQEKQKKKIPDHPKQPLPPKKDEMKETTGWLKLFKTKTSELTWRYETLLGKAKQDHLSVRDHVDENGPWPMIMITAIFVLCMWRHNLWPKFSSLDNIMHWMSVKIPTQKKYTKYVHLVNVTWFTTIFLSL